MVAGVVAGAATAESGVSQYLNQIGNVGRHLLDCSVVMFFQILQWATISISDEVYGDSLATCNEGYFIEHTFKLMIFRGIEFLINFNNL